MGFRAKDRFWRSASLLHYFIFCFCGLLGLYFLLGCGEGSKSGENGVANESQKNSYSYIDLVRNYAPIFVQSFKSKYDIPTRFDFDGDFIGNNNWENAESATEIPPAVYYDVKETKKFLFIYYALFYPRDYLLDCKNPPPPENCHENDFEEMLIAIQKTNG